MYYNSTLCATLYFNLNSDRMCMEAKSKKVTILLYRSQFKDESSFDDILKALEKDPDSKSIVLNLTEEDLQN